MKNTYLLLHPSSNVIVDYIFERIQKNQFNIEGVYRIGEWDSILDNLYENSYPRAVTCKAHVHAHKYINNYFFGNKALVILLSKNIPIEELINDTLKLKKEIRSFKTETKDKTISIYLNKMPDFSNVDVFFSYVHCPDSMKQYEEDFKTLEQFFVNKLSDSEIQAVIKYHSYY